VSLTADQLPAHQHPLRAGGPATTASAAGAYPAAWADNPYTADASAAVAMSAGEVQPSGGSLPHPNRQPYLSTSFIISLTGIYPSRG
jgi:microcystin-dependent protein